MMKFTSTNMFDIHSILLCTFSLFILIQESTQNSLTGKRPAWMPQGRMGKRNNLIEPEDKKAAWVPQGRFGKRMQPELTDQQELAAILGAADSSYTAALLNNDKRIPRMGLFQKKDTFPRMGYLNKKGSSEENSLEKVKDSIDSSIVKYFNLLLTKNQQLEDGDVDSIDGDEEAMKRAAWVPQGRFGKRSALKDLQGSPQENDSMGKVRITDVTRHPTDPQALCFTVKQDARKQGVQCARLNEDGTGLTPVTSH